MLSVARAHVHPEVLLDELDSRGYCMWGRDILLKSREARHTPIRPMPILHGCGEPLDDVTLRFCVHRRRVVDAPPNKNGPIMPMANKAGEDALCCMLTAH